MSNIFKRDVVSACIVLVAMVGLNAPVYAQEDRTLELVKPSGNVKVKQLKPLMHKGKPIFPIGGWHLPRRGKGGTFMTMDQVRRGGWTASLMNLDLKNEEHVKQILARADAAGMAVIINVSHLVHSNHRELLRQKILTFRQFPAANWGHILNLQSLRFAKLKIEDATPQPIICGGQNSSVEPTGSGILGPIVK